MTLSLKKLVKESTRLRVYTIENYLNLLGQSVNFNESQLDAVSTMCNDIRDKIDSIDEIVLDPNLGLDGQFDSDEPNKLYLRTGLDSKRAIAVAFHELVHAAGGEELDAEIFEYLNALFLKDNTYGAPTASDYALFSVNGGKWFDWNNTEQRAVFQGYQLPWPSLFFGK